MGKSYFWHYEYDLANRLTLGMMYDADAFNRQSGEGERFVYDKMGNISLLLRRHNGTDADCLNTIYRGNQMQKTTNVGGGNYDYDFPGYQDASDEETEVTYDANGNETANLDKGIVAVRYNILNLPDTIQFSNGNRIVNHYFAGGEKAGSVSRTYLTPLSVPMDEVTDSNDPHIDVRELWRGKMMFKNGTPDRILFDGGYFSLANNSGGSVLNPKIYVYIRDHLGSTRLVCDGNSGKVVQSLEYFPSGLIFRSSNFDWQSYRFTGKELITVHGLNWYDSKARMQEFQIPGFKSLDPLCENYYGISPYSYCAGNPVRYVDPTGKDITVLNLGHGKNQHSAMLIQNEQGKWQYFSVNGNNVYSSGQHSGGRKFDDLAVGEWITPQEFMDSDYNNSGNKDDKNTNSYGYTEGYVISTTPEQDNVIRETFIDISKNEDYGIISNNCATAVQKSLKSAGIETKQTQKIPANRSLGESGYTVKSNPFIPSIAFKTIRQNNPNGTYIKKNK